MDHSKKKAQSYSEAWTSYREAENRIGRILSEHRTSRIAVGLSSGDTLIAGLTLDQFRKLEEPLKELSEAEQSPLACALLLAKKIEPGSDRSRSLAHVAGGFAQAGHKERALQLLAQALSDARTKHRPDLPLLCAIAGKYAELGQQEHALRILSQAQTDALTIVWKYDGMVMNCRAALVDVAITYAGMGNLERAEEALDLIGQRSVSRSKAYAVMAGECAEAGDFRRAYGMADKIEGSANDEADALMRIAGAYADSGQKEKALLLLPRALEAAQKMDDDYMRSMALIRLAGRYVDAGEKEQATHLLSQVLELAKTSGRSQMDEVLTELAQRHVENGDFHLALEAARTLSEADE